MSVSHVKKIVIVGATSGIGLGVAEQLLKEGMRVGVAGRKIDALRQLQAKYPTQVEYASIDITQSDAPEHLTDLVNRLGGMDIYFHISGIGYANDELQPAKELATMATNVVGFTRMIDVAFAYFRDNCNGRGHIAAITSVAGTNGLGQLAAYSSSKRFQQTYLRSLHQLATIQHLKIKFTDIRPGWIRTPLLVDGHSYPMIMSLQYAVPRIVRAIKRKKRVAVIDWRWNILVGLWKLIPNCIWVRLPIPVDAIASTSSVQNV